MQKAFKAFAQQGEIVGLEGVAGLFQGQHGIVQGLTQVINPMGVGSPHGLAMRCQQTGFWVIEDFAVDAGGIEQLVRVAGPGCIQAKNL